MRYQNTPTEAEFARVKTVKRAHAIDKGSRYHEFLRRSAAEVISRKSVWFVQMLVSTKKTELIKNSAEARSSKHSSK